MRFGRGPRARCSLISSGKVGGKAEGLLHAAGTLSGLDTAPFVPLTLDIPAFAVVATDAFDAFLLLRGPGATSESDDDSGGNCNPRITITFPETGTYRIGANTVSGRARGAYSLLVTRGSRERSSARCEQSRFN